MEVISNSKSTEKHFCIFDEIYSGTNPYEAMASAHSYLNYLSKYKNVSFLITTHYIDLCKKIDKSELNIKNMHMKVNNKEDLFEYSYILRPGISEVKGGVKVLKDLGYPTDMINTTDKYLTQV